MLESFDCAARSCWAWALSAALVRLTVPISSLIVCPVWVCSCEFWSIEPLISAAEPIWPAAEVKELERVVLAACAPATAAVIAAVVLTAPV